MMCKGREAMGNRKHGRSGRAPKSPKLRLSMKMDAEKNERKRRKSGKMFETVADAFRHGGRQ